MSVITRNVLFFLFFHLTEAPVAARRKKNNEKMKTSCGTAIRNHWQRRDLIGARVNQLAGFGRKLAALINLPLVNHVLLVERSLNTAPIVVKIKHPRYASPELADRVVLTCNKQSEPRNNNTKATIVLLVTR